MNLANEYERARYVLRSICDRYAREIEFVGDVELESCIDTLEAWCEAARNTIRPPLAMPVKKSRKTNKPGASK
jgi:hypothetical protein